MNKASAQLLDLLYLTVQFKDEYSRKFIRLKFLWISSSSDMIISYYYSLFFDKDSMFEQNETSVTGNIFFIVN